MRAALRARAVLAAVPALAACACAGGPARPDRTAPYRPVATVQELMLNTIDPCADALWDAVAYISSPAGVEDRRPRSDAEWQDLRARALTLIEAVNLLAMPGRPVSGAPAAPVAAGELSAPEIQARIRDTRPAFVQFGRVLQQAGLEALAAIDARDPQQLLEVGSRLDEACEACHLTYWYPPPGARGR